MITKKLLPYLLLPALLLAAACDPVEKDRQDQAPSATVDEKALDAWAGTFNSDLSSLRMVISALADEVYIKSIAADADGWTLELSDGKTPYFSKGGAALDVATPLVSVKETDGIWYWTLEGAVVKDASGDVPVSKAALKVRRNDGVWEYSSDGGKTWTAAPDATGTGKALVSDIPQDAYNANITLQDGVVVGLSKLDKLGISFPAGDLVIAPGQTLEVAFTLTGATASTTVEASAEAGSVSVRKNGDAAGVIVVTAPDPVGDFKVSVTARDGDRTAAAQLDFEGGLITVADASFDVTADETTVEIPLSTNYKYTVDVGENTWISYVSTKAVRNETVTLGVAANTGSEMRIGMVQFLVGDIPVAVVAIVQAAPRPEYPEFFVKAEAAGTKDGSSWENAMGPDEVRTLLEVSYSSGTTVDAAAMARRGGELDGAHLYFAAGEYVLNAGASPIVVDFTSFNEGTATKYCDITLQGGFRPTLAGTDLSDRKIDEYPTTIKGGTATAGLMVVRDAAHVAFDGFKFNGIKAGQVFLVDNAADGRAMLDLDDCYFEDCGDASKSGGMENAVVYLKQGIARLNHVIFNRCYGGGRGPVFGANTNNGYLFMNRCAIYSTQGVSTWGAAVSSNMFTMVNNSTFAHQSKCNNGSFGGKNYLFCNSTLVQMTPAFEGLLRVAGGGFSYVINSIVENQNTTVNASQASNTYRICENSTMESGGYNISNSVASVKSGKFIENEKDRYDIPYAGLGLSFDGDLFVMDITKPEVLPAERISEATLKDRISNCLTGDSAYSSEQGICKDFIAWIEAKGGFAMDQAGNPRPAAGLCPGAYEVAE